MLRWTATKTAPHSLGPISRRVYMRLDGPMLAMLMFSGVLLCACGGSGSSSSTPGGPTQSLATAAPTISTVAAQNGAVVVSLASVSSGATIYYTVDGTTPTSSSQVYQA